MTKAHNVDAQRLSFILNELRLPAIKVIWPEFTERADKEGWPATRLLAALTEHEMAERDRRRIERHLSDARLPPGKTLDSFAFDARSEEHTSELQSLMRISYAVFCLKKKNIPINSNTKKK